MSYALRTIVTPFADIRLTETAGDALPVLLLHGSSASRRAFEHQLASRVGARHRMIALDLPGHGESGDAHDPASGYSLAGLTDCVADVLRQLGVDRVAVFGWSLGGHVAMELIHRHPGVAGLMLMGAPPVSRGALGMLRAFHTSWDMLLASKEHYSPRDIERFAHLCYGADAPGPLVDAIRRTDGRLRPVFSRSMMRGECADQRHTVENATIPIAIINGEHDPFIRHAYFDGLNIPTLWDDRVRTMPGAGHAAFRDSPEQFNALLGRFAADVVHYRAPRPQQVALRA